MKIDWHYAMDPPFGPDDHERMGIGGTENFITYASQYLECAGHEVRVYTKTAQVEGRFRPLHSFVPEEPRDVLLTSRVRDVFDNVNLQNTRLRAIVLADTESHGLGDAVRANRIDLVMFVSEWQAEKISAEEGIAEKNQMVTSNGAPLELFDRARAETDRVMGKCVHLSTPERGLEPLLELWPKIHARAPFASLHLFSSFKGWRVTATENESMSAMLYSKADRLRQRGLAVENHKHCNAGEMRAHLASAELFLYPTRHFNETCCISAIEAAAAGLPIVATGRAALCERVDHGVTGYLVAEADHHDEVFVDCATRLLNETKLWTRMSEASLEFARQFDYGKIVWDWQHRWSYEIALRG